MVYGLMMSYKLDTMTSTQCFILTTGELLTPEIISYMTDLIRLKK